MINTHLVQRLQGIQSALMAQYSGSSGLPSATAGTERETFLREYLQTLFPAHRRFTSGVITDSYNVISGQVDIAVEYGLTPSFPMPGGTERLLLAESVAAVIEVKSDLASQWGQVETTTAKVKRLRRNLNSVILVGGNHPGREIPVIAVGYRGHSSPDALKTRLESTAQASRPDAALVIESGAFHGFGLAGTGCVGLFALAISIDRLFQQLVSAQPNLSAYANSTPPPN